LSDGMKVDYNKRHIETEKKFYKRMNKKRSFLLSLGIASIGYIFLFIRLYIIGYSGTAQELIWVITMVALFFELTVIGYFVFEHERKKWTAV
jgi:fatty acid desaturase